MDVRKKIYIIKNKHQVAGQSSQHSNAAVYYKHTIWIVCSYDNEWYVYGSCI